MDSLTVHGLPKVFISKRPLLKLIWAAVFLFACSLLGFFLLERVTQYNMRKTSVRFERATASSMNLPTLTICDTDLRYDEQSIEFTEFPNSCMNQSSNETTKLFRYGCKLFMSQVGFSCVYDFSSKCNFPKHFSPLRNYYQCFTFNKNGTLVQSINERNNGIDLLLFKNTSDSNTESVIGNNPLRRFSQGLRLFIHASEKTMGMSQENAISLTPGYQVEVSLTRKVIKRLPKPFASKCSNVTSVKQRIGGTYTRKNCLTSCLFNQIYEKCGKVTEHALPYMPLKDYPTTKKFINDNVYNLCRLKDVFSKGLSLCDCPLQCQDVVYETQITQKPWQASALSNSMRSQLGEFFNIPPNEVNLDLMNENIIHLKVFFDDFTTLSIVEQEMYSLESLLCDFGGLMGLLIGASAISLLEILWTLTQVLFKKCHKSKVKTADNELMECT